MPQQTPQPPSTTKRTRTVAAKRHNCSPPDPKHQHQQHPHQHQQPQPHRSTSMSSSRPYPSSFGSVSSRSIPTGQPQNHVRPKIGRVHLPVRRCVNKASYNPHTSRLKLQCSSLDRQDVEYVVQFLQKTPRITKLHLECNINRSDGAFDVWSEYFSGKKKQLMMGNNKVTTLSSAPSAATRWQKDRRDSSPRRLRQLKPIYNNKHHNNNNSQSDADDEQDDTYDIDEPGPGASHQIVEIDVLGDFDVLEGRFKELDDGSCMECLAQALQFNASVTKMRFWGCDPYKNCIHLRNLLCRKRHGLIKLKLEDCVFGIKGAMLLAQGLKALAQPPENGDNGRRRRPSALQEFRLVMEFLSLDGKVVSTIVQSLQDAPRLAVLQLEHVGLTRPSVRSVLQWLSHRDGGYLQAAHARWNHHHHHHNHNKNNKRNNNTSSSSSNNNTSKHHRQGSHDSSTSDVTMEDFSSSSEDVPDAADVSSCSSVSDEDRGSGNAVDDEEEKSVATSLSLLSSTTEPSYVPSGIDLKHQFLSVLKESPNVYTRDVVFLEDDMKELVQPELLPFLGRNQILIQRRDRNPGATATKAAAAQPHHEQLAQLVLRQQQPPQQQQQGGASFDESEQGLILEDEDFGDDVVTATTTHDSIQNKWNVIVYGEQWGDDDGVLQNHGNRGDDDNKNKGEDEQGVAL